MSFSSWTDFFHMGGYALYVWASYGLTLGVLAVIMVTPWLRHRRLKREQARQARRQRRQTETAGGNEP